MSILHDSYGGKSTKNLPQWAIPFFIGTLPSPIEILWNLGNHEGNGNENITKQKIYM